MKRYRVVDEVLPFVSQALKEHGVEKYTICKDGVQNEILMDVSSRNFVKIRRKALALKRSSDAGITILCRDDTNSSGVIPDDEKYWFDKNNL